MATWSLWSPGPAQHEFSGFVKWKTFCIKFMFAEDRIYIYVGGGRGGLGGGH